MNRDPWWLAVADRVYALALYAYPRDFRETWGPQMRQAMRDRWRACAEQGRSAFATIVVLFPDLLASAGREHWTDADGASGTRRLALSATLLASLGLFAMQGRLSVQVAAWQEAGKARQWRQTLDREAAYREQLRKLAVASRQPDVRALGWTLLPLAAQPPADIGTPVPVADGRNRLADFLAAASCTDPATLARLQASEPGNGAVWAVAATCAMRANDPERARRALSRLARADGYDSRSGMLLAAATGLLRQAQSSSLPAPGPGDGGGQPLAPNPRAGAATFLEAALWNAHEAEFDAEAFGRLCTPGAFSADAMRATDCRVAAEVMSRADSNAVRAIGRGRLFLLEKRDPDPTAQRAQRERRAAWQRALLAWTRLDDSARRARIAAGGNETDLLRD